MPKKPKPQRKKTDRTKGLKRAVPKQTRPIREKVSNPLRILEDPSKIWNTGYISEDSIGGVPRTSAAVRHLGTTWSKGLDRNQHTLNTIILHEIFEGATAEEIFRNHSAHRTRAGLVQLRSKAYDIKKTLIDRLGKIIEVMKRRKTKKNAVSFNRIIGKIEIIIEDMRKLKVKSKEPIANPSELSKKYEFILGDLAAELKSQHPGQTEKIIYARQSFITDPRITDELREDVINDPAFFDFSVSLNSIIERYL